MRKSTRALLGVATILLLTVATQAWPGQQEDSYDSLLARIRSLLSQRLPEEAVQPLSEALRLRPDSVEALWLMGVLSLELGRFEEGVPHVTRLIELAPEEIQPRLLLGTLLEPLGRVDDAVVQYREVLARDPYHRDALMAVGKLALQAEDVVAAEQVINNLVARYPTDQGAQILHGRFYAFVGAYREALLVLQSAVLLVPSDPLESAEAQYLLGTVYAELGQVDLARHHLENALQLTPENGPSLLQLGLLAANQERAEEALSYFERAVELMPEDGRAHFRLGEALQYLREMSAAEEALRTAISLNPELYETRLQLGMLYLETSRNDAALTELTRAAALAPDNATIRHQLGRAAMEVGDESMAQREFEAALQLDSFLSEAYLALGNLLVRQGQSERGRGLLTRFRDLQRDEAAIATMFTRLSETPSDASAQRSLLSYLLDRDRQEQALNTVVGWIAAGLSPCNNVSEVYKAALPVSDDPSAVLLGLGQLLLECSQPTDAITYLEQARSSDPASVELLLALARAYEQIGQSETATRLRAEAQALRTPR